MMVTDETFGECIDWTLLNEPIRDLFECAVDMATVAFQAARLQIGSTQVAYPIRICFPNKPTFNAATCDLDEGGSVIAINASVPYLIFSACYIYAARADSRTGLPVQRDDKVLVYDEAFELIDRLPAMPAQPSEYGALFDNLLSAPHYRDAHFLYALYLFVLGMRFFVMHEVMHIVLGHTAYLHDTKGSGALTEFGEERETVLATDVSQCLEFLADRHAIRGLVRKLVDRDPHFTTVAQTELLAKATVDDVTYVLRAVMTVATLMFHLYPTRNDTLGNPTHAHPEPYTRTQWLAMELGHELGNECQYVEAVLLPFAMVAATMMSNFRSPGRWRRVAEQDVNSNDSGKSHSDTAYEQVLALAQRWSSTIYQRYGPKFISSHGVLIP